MKMSVDEWWWRNWKKVIVKKIKDGETEVKCPKLSRKEEEYKDDWWKKHRRIAQKK